MSKKLFFIGIVTFVILVILAFTNYINQKENPILSHTIDLKKQDLRLFWKNKKGKKFSNFNRLKSWASEQNKKLVFATNGGMYKKDQSPLGLYIENGVILSPLNSVKKAFGNFYLQPNGVFYITNNKEGKVCKTDDFDTTGVKYATQSGPMLLIDGAIHPAFKKGSTNLNIRNGVGILPNKQLVFAMSKSKINFYDFAQYFKSLGCKNALYLDGYVSKTYLPQKKWVTTGGNFGVMIAEIKDL